MRPAAVVALGGLALAGLVWPLFLIPSPARARDVRPPEIPAACVRVDMPKSMPVDTPEQRAEWQRVIYLPVVYSHDGRAWLCASEIERLTRVIEELRADVGHAENIAEFCTTWAPRPKR